MGILIPRLAGRGGWICSGVAVAVVVASAVAVRVPVTARSTGLERQRQLQKQRQLQLPRPRQCPEAAMPQSGISSERRARLHRPYARRSAPDAKPSVLRAKGLHHVRRAGTASSHGAMSPCRSLIPVHAARQRIPGSKPVRGRSARCTAAPAWRPRPPWHAHPRLTRCRRRL